MFSLSPVSLVDFIYVTLCAIGTLFARELYFMGENFRAGRVWVFLVPILIFGAAVAGRNLSADPIWHDEYFSLWIAGGLDGAPLQSIWARAFADLVHPPLYYYLMALWGTVAGWSAFAGRYFSLLCGVLSIAWAARLAIDVRGRLAGVGAAALLAGSPFFVIYMHELRSYTLVALLTLSTVLVYRRVVRAHSRLGLQVAFMLNVLALFYVHYVGTFLLAALAMVHLLCAPKNRAWWRILWWMGLPALAYLVWVVPVLRAYASGGKDEVSLYIETLSLWGLVWTILREFGAGNVALLATLMLLGGATRELRRLWLLLAGVLLITKGFDLLMPVLFNVRYVLFVWGFVAVLGGAGIAALGQRWRAAAVVLCVMWLALGWGKSFDTPYRLGINGPGAFAAWDVSATALENRAEPNDTLVLHLPEHTRFSPYHAPIADYYLRYLHGLTLNATGIESLRLQPDTDYLHEAFNRVPVTGRFWYARDLGQIPERYGVFERELATRYLWCGQFERNEKLWLDLYTAPPTAQTIVGSFDGQAIRIAPISDLARVRAGRVQVALVWWVADDVAPHTFSYGLHLTDANGALVSQVDSGLPAAGQSCEAHELDVSQLPTGRYTLRLLVYAWESGERLPAQAPTQETPTDALTLSVFEIP